MTGIKHGILAFIVAIDEAKKEMVLGAISGIGMIHFAKIDLTVFAPIIATFLIPFLKQFGKEIIIPYFKKILKLK